MDFGATTAVAVLQRGATTAVGVLQRCEWRAMPRKYDILGIFVEGLLPCDEVLFKCKSRIFSEPRSF